MLTAYFDESGTDRNQSTALTVAGYGSTGEMWQRFELEWKQMLVDYGLDYFHMAELAHFTKQFKEDKGWDEPRRVSVLERAHDIINRHVLQDFDSSLVWADYDEVIKSYRRRSPPSAYAVLVNACLSQVGKWATERGHAGNIRYVLESGVDGEGWVKRNYERAGKDSAARESFHFGGLTYDKKHKLQLQAAHINAYESRLQMQNRVVSGKLRKTRESFMNLKGQSGYVSVRYFDREGLREYLSSIEAEDVF